jgi:hypothetical protein
MNFTRTHGQPKKASSGEMYAPGVVATSPDIAASADGERVPPELHKMKARIEIAADDEAFKKIRA